jgi:ATP-dependent protease HslVU (ClpYQ) ATPase subunit
MDGRRILEEVLTIVSNEEFEKWKTRLKKADEKIMESLVPTSKCIWGELAEIKYGYNREKDWWYFNRPNKIDYTWNVL